MLMVFFKIKIEGGRIDGRPDGMVIFQFSKA